MRDLPVRYVFGTGVATPTPEPASRGLGGQETLTSNKTDVKTPTYTKKNPEMYIRGRMLAGSTWG